MNQRSERSRRRSRGILSSLLLSQITTDLLLDGLTEIGLHSLGPVLVEVLAGDNCKERFLATAINI